MLILVLGALAAWSYFQVFLAPDYGTDEIAFDQYAAQLALHGIDPYLHSMAAAFPLFHVSPNGYTFRLSGQPVTSLSYPALSFEAYLPLLALGLSTQAAVWTDVAAWALGGIVLFAVLPKRLGPVVVALLSLDVYIGYAVGGVTDFLFVPLLIGAAVRWDRFPWLKGPAAWRGPVLLGLAMAVKQTPWLVVPFVLVVHRGRVAPGPRLAPGPPRRAALPGHRAGRLPGPQPALPGPGPGRVAARHPHPAVVRRRARRAGPDQPQPLAARRRRLAARLHHRRAGRHGRRPGLLRRDLPAAQAGRVPAALGGPVLRHPLVRQLPGHAPPARHRRRGDRAPPARPGLLAALEVGRGRQRRRLRGRRSPPR